MPEVALPASPSAFGRSVRLQVRDSGGDGPVLVLLHGGWGHGYYPWDLDALRGFRILAPDRTGYGRSSPLPAEGMPLDFHARAAEETRLLLDALGVGEALLWGHSDGAVIALHLALLDPERFPGIVAEATHLWKRKPASRVFFETAAKDPAGFGARVAERLEADHGPGWRRVIQEGGRAWLALADSALAGSALADSAHVGDDLYGGRLPDIRTRVLALHGERDPRTEPGEFDALMKAIPGARPALIPEGQHAPHAEAACAVEAHRLAVKFLDA